MTKFTYNLERMGWDDRIRGIQAIDQVNVRSGEDEINRIRGIGQGHVHPGEDRMIRLEVFGQFTKITYSLERLG